MSVIRDGPSPPWFPAPRFMSKLEGWYNTLYYFLVFFPHQKVVFQSWTVFFKNLLFDPCRRADPSHYVYNLDRRFIVTFAPTKEERGKAGGGNTKI